MGTRENAVDKDFSGIPLEEEVEEELKETAIISMGTEISPVDLLNIMSLCDQVHSSSHPSSCCISFTVAACQIGLHLKRNSLPTKTCPPDTCPPESCDAVQGGMLMLVLCGRQVIALAEYRAQLYDYLKSRMMAIAPNLTVLVGELVGARLIAHAGSLVNLAKQPASTVQILGAEKALFRALKTKHEVWSGSGTHFCAVYLCFRPERLHEA